MSALPDDYLNLTEIEKIENVHFPELKGGKRYKKTSDSTNHYNCLAWALGINWTRYDPEPHCPGYFWFPGVERVWSVANIRKIVEYHKYTSCEDGKFEQGYEKIAFYIHSTGTPEHFARQLANGKWTSKLGDLIDIEHDDLECLIIEEYGTPKLFFKRKIAIDAKT